MTRDAPSDGAPDWFGALRRLRREELVAVPAVCLFFAGLVLLTGGFGFWDGSAAWVAAGVALAVGAAVVTGVSVVRGPEWRRGSRRVQAALRLHADPGPDLRARADRQAGYLVEVRQVGWFALAAPVWLVVAGQWAEEPVRAAAGAVVVVSYGVAGWALWRRQVADAQRWVADPPGPPRPTPPPSAVGRWARPARVLLVVLGLLALGVLIGLVASFV